MSRVLDQETESFMWLSWWGEHSRQKAQLSRRPKSGISCDCTKVRKEDIEVGT